MLMQEMTKVPAYIPDIYSGEAILDPYPHYTAMRALGPLVYLPQHDIYAIPRHAEVRKALLAHTRFLSSHGVGAFEWPPQFRAPNTLNSDEPEHSRFRQVIGAPLSPPALEQLRERIEAAADDLIAHLVVQGDFDGMADFARYLPVSIVSSLVGLPELGRRRMLDWAAAGFDLLGPDNDRTKAAWAEAAEMVHYVHHECRAETVAPAGWAAQIWRAVANGRITPHEAGMLHIDILAPSLDTTIFATGHLLHRLATNPVQWLRLKEDSSLIANAIDEAVRLESPIRAFARVTAEEQDVGGTMLPAGARVLMMYGSANRDERPWEEPERFWIERPGLSGQLGFGQGRHVCVGMHLAKLEITALLKAMLRRVERIEVGQPVLRVNNVLRGFASLPTRFHPAA